MSAIHNVTPYLLHAPTCPACGAKRGEPCVVYRSLRWNGNGTIRAYMHARRWELTS